MLINVEHVELQILVNRKTAPSDSVILKQLLEYSIIYFMCPGNLKFPNLGKEQKYRSAHLNIIYSQQY